MSDSCFVCGEAPELKQVDSFYGGSRVFGYHRMSAFGEPVCLACWRAERARPAVAGASCLLCGHEETFSARFGEPVCSLCDAIVEGFDAHASVQESFVAVIRHELPSDLRRPFAELLAACPSSFQFLRAFEITMYDVGCVTMAAYSKGPSPVSTIRRPPAYEDEPGADVFADVVNYSDEVLYVFSSHPR